MASRDRKPIPNHRAQDRASKRSENPAALRTDAGVRVAARWSWVLPWLFMGLSVGLYWNADHEQFLFDSAHGKIVCENPAKQLRRDLQVLYIRPIYADASLSRASFHLNAVVNDILGLPAFDVTGFLVVNAIIHGINAWLVFHLVLTMLRLTAPGRAPPVWIALSLALLFLVHPLQAASVAYIMQRRGMLATTFFILGILVYLTGRHRCFRVSCNKERRFALTQFTCCVRYGLLVLLCYWLSIRSKQLGLTLPFALLMIEFAFRAVDVDSLRRYLRVFIPAVVIATIPILVYLSSHGLFFPERMQFGWFGPSEIESWGAWPHFLTESRVFWHYWKLLLLPLPRWMAIDHDVSVSRSLLEHGAVLAVVGHGLLLWVAVFIARRGYLLAAIGVFWFYVALIPYVLLPQPELMVEYKTYLPSVGMALIVAEGLRIVTRRVPVPVVAPATLILAVILAFGTFHRNTIYQSRLSLWSDAVSKYPDKPRVAGNYGTYLVHAHRFEEAISHLTRSLERRPDQHMVHYNLAFANMQLGRFDEAIAHFERTLDLEPTQLQAISNLATLYAHRGHLDRAEQLYREAVALDPENGVRYRNLAVLLEMKGDLQTARRVFVNAVKFGPEDPETWKLLAKLLIRLQDRKAAVYALKRVIELAPEDAEAEALLIGLTSTRPDDA